MNPRFRFPSRWLALTLFVRLGVLIAATTTAATERMDFDHHIKPILAEHCFSCHGPEKQRGNLRLDVKLEALKGGDSGSVLRPGNSAESLLIRAVAGTDPDIEQMPLNRDPLSAEQISRLTAWMDQGAEWPDAAGPIRDTRLDHWAFKAPLRPAVPDVSTPNWPRNTIDRFILKRLEQEKLPPAAEADKITLLRRLSLDLIGLPPTIAEVDAFLADDSADAYEKQVERLLASPHYGERWGAALA